MELYDAAKIIKDFENKSLGNRLSLLEAGIKGKGKVGVGALCKQHGVSSTLLTASFDLKNIAAQINVIIHAVGILCALPHILNEHEIIEYVSLGAGNTGRKFDLETNCRVGEFKFINWRGGPESIRQNSLFKDFYYLAEEETNKKKFLYVLGLSEPLNFLNGGRSLESVMSRNKKFRDTFLTKHMNKFSVVNEYYDVHRNRVELIDLLPMLPELSQVVNLLSDTQEEF